MKSSYKIAVISGIPIELHISFIILFGFVVFFSILSGNFGTAVYILMIFTLVVLHELSHSFVARKFGVKINKVVLLPIGGVANMGEIPRDARKEFLIAIAGPLLNFGFALLSGIAILIMGIQREVLPFFTMQLTSPADLIVVFFKINLILGLFNLFIPALPMDGGRVFRSLLAFRMGFTRATMLASEIAKALAIFMALFGFFMPNIWLIIIAFFVYMGAVQEAEFASLSALLSGVRVRDIMSYPVVTVSPDLTLEEFYDFVFKHRYHGYPVVEDGTVIGVVSFTDLAKVPRSEWNNLTVRDIMSHHVITINPWESAFKAMKKMSEHGISRLIVTENGEMIGVISKTDLIRIIELQRLIE